MAGLSRSGSISFGWAFVAGRKRVPSPAAGMTALRTALMGLGAYPRTFRAMHVFARGYTFHDAHLRVRMHLVRSAHRGLSTNRRGSADDLRGLRRNAPQGVPPSGDRLQGLRLLRDRQPFGSGEEERWRRRLEHGVVRRCEVRQIQVQVDGDPHRDLDAQEGGCRHVTVARIGVFGGSGFYSFLEDTQTVSVETPYGG